MLWYFFLPPLSFMEHIDWAGQAGGGFQNQTFDRLAGREAKPSTCLSLPRTALPPSLTLFLSKSYLFLFGLLLFLFVLCLCICRGYLLWGWHAASAAEGLHFCSLFPPSSVVFFLKGLLWAALGPAFPLLTPPSLSLCLPSHYTTQIWGRAGGGIQAGHWHMEGRAPFSDPPHFISHMRQDQVGSSPSVVTSMPSLQA